MQVSIVIVTYNTAKLTQQCIDSIFDHTDGVDFEVIVVDNDSCDGTDRTVGLDKRIRYIRNDANLGFGRANNVGIAQSEGEYVLLLNSDTILRDNAVRTMYDSSVRYGNRLGALGCILESEDGEPIHSFGTFPTIWSSMWDPYRRLFRRGNGEDTVVSGQYRKVDYVTGADMMVPRTVIEKTGVFDPRFFMYAEECDWQKRMAVKDLDRIVIPAAGIIHLEGRSESMARSGWSYNRYFNAIRSRIIYIRKHYCTARYVAFRILFIPFRLPIILTAPFSWSQKWSLITLLAR